VPKRLHRQAKAAICEIYQTETQSDADAGIDEFVNVYGDKYPNGATKLPKDRDVLLTFCTFPATHQVHLRTTNPIESTFAAARVRRKVTKPAGTRRRGLVMAAKHLDVAKDRWGKVNSPELVAPSALASGSKSEARSNGESTSQGTPPKPPDPV